MNSDIKKMLENKKIYTLLLTSIIGWGLYLLLFLLTSHFSYTLNLDFLLHDKYLADPPDWFRDFFEVAKSTASLDSYLTGSCANYPPLALIFGKFTSFFLPGITPDTTVYDIRATLAGKIGVSFFLVSSISLLAYLVHEYYKKNTSYSDFSIKLLTFFSISGYCTIYFIERANHIIIAVIAFTIFVFTFDRNEIVSGIALAVCASLKVYPVFFMLFFLIYKKYKGFLICGFSGLLLTLFPIFIFKGTFWENINGFFNAVFLFNSTSQQAKGEVSFSYVEQHSNSLKNIFRAIALYIDNTDVLIQYSEKSIWLLEKTATLAIFVILAMGIFVVLKENVFWKKLCAMTCLLLLIPNNTFDYTLMLFIPVLVLAICSNSEACKNDFWYIFCLTLLICIPKSVYFFKVGVDDVSIQCVINPIIMMLIVIQLFVDIIKSQFLPIEREIPTYSFDKNATVFIKGFAICSIVYFHSISCMDESMYVRVSCAFERLVGKYGNIGVVGFAFLSAYGLFLKNQNISNPYFKTGVSNVVHSLKSFYSKYIPIFIIASVFSVFLSPNWMDIRYIYGQDGPALTVLRFLINLLGINHLVYGDNMYTLNQTWWYNSLAILIIIFVPFLAMLYKRFKFSTCLLMITASLALSQYKYMQYLAVIALALIIADNNVFAKAKKWTQIRFTNSIFLIISSIAISILWYVCRSTEKLYPYYVLVDTIYVVPLCIFLFVFGFFIRPLKHIFSFIGKHSGNIYWIHSFIYIYYPSVSKFIYKLKYDLLIVVAVLVISIVCSLLLEFIKKMIIVHKPIISLKKLHITKEN